MLMKRKRYRTNEYDMHSCEKDISMFVEILKRRLPVTKKVLENSLNSFQLTISGIAPF